jgi:hypothetical protein
LKRFLTHLFVFAANYYLLSMVVGIILMTFTLFSGSLNELFCVCVALLSLVVSFAYEFIRNKFTFYSFGEIIIGNIDKNDILVQTRVFSMTRWPLFILIILTLLINCNLFRELGYGQVYTFGFIVFYIILFFCTYYGIQNFCIKPDLLPLFLLLAGLLYASVMFKQSPLLFIPGLSFDDAYYSLIFWWLIVGWVWMKKRNLSQ